MIAMAEGTDEVVTFRVGKQWFGLPVIAVQEVISHQQTARVPLARSCVAGLLNLRGQVVTAIDMHDRMEISANASESLMDVVVCDGGELFALVVDEVGDVVAVPPHTLERLPASLDGLWARICTGVVRLDNGLLALIDVARLLDESSTRPYTEIRSMTTRIDLDELTVPSAAPAKNGNGATKPDRRKTDRRSGALRERKEVDELETKVLEAQTHARGIMHVAGATARAGNESEAARGALEAVRAGFAWPYGSHWTVDSQSEYLQFNLESGAVNNEFHRVTVSASYAEADGLVGKAWRYRDVFIVDDLQYLQDRRGEVAQAAGCTAAIALPLSVGGEVVGALDFFVMEPLALSDERIDVLRRVAE